MDTTTQTTSAAAGSPLQGAEYFKNLAKTGNPAEQSAANNWLSRNGLSATEQQNNLIVTGTKPEKQFAENTQQLTQAINKTVPPPVVQPEPQLDPEQEQKQMFKDMESYSDPYTQMLDKISATSDKATQNLIATIKASKANRMRDINQETDRLKSGLMSLGLSTGNINFTPDLIYGSIAQAENARMSKLAELDRDEATTLLEAQQASEDKDFKVLKEKMDYYKTIKKSRLDLLKESYDTMNYQTKIGEIQAFQIYDELQKMPESSKLPFLQEIANKFNIPLAALTSQVTELKRDREVKKTTSSSQTKVNLKETGNKILVSGKDQAGNFIGNPKGADGYVDPYVYKALYEDFPGTSAEFLTMFPLKNVNPESYELLPEALLPKTKSSSSGFKS